MKVDNAINSVVILGGGTAGWMTAISLAKYAQTQPLKITLIQSNEIETIGVGEATLPNIVDFNYQLGIDEKEFIEQTEASFKLGIEFKDWYKPAHAFFHPFADYGMKVKGVDFHHFYHKAKQQGLDAELADFCLSTQLASKGKFYIPQKIDNDLEDFGYAYHFDAGLYAEFLKKKSIVMGVQHLIATVEKVTTDAESGFIQSLTLNSGEVIESDLFIDCSGFTGRLIEQTLEVGYEHWNEWLLCDRAVAVHSQGYDQVTPFTVSKAKSAGWQWRIPLQHRVGNGYIYSSQHISDEDAKQSLLDDLDGDAITEPRVIKFHPGRRNKIWHKNCFAIGLSSGFIEPLESTSISLIQSAISKLLTFFPDKSFHQADIDEVNRLHNLEVERVRDFIILHYKLTKRDDSDFWLKCQSMDIPESLRHKIALYQSRGHINQQECESFEQSSWLSMFAGFCMTPDRVDPRTMHVNDTALLSDLRKIKQFIEEVANKAPTHREFINTLKLKR